MRRGLRRGRSDPGLLVVAVLAAGLALVLQPQPAAGEPSRLGLAAAGAAAIASAAPRVELRLDGGGTVVLDSVVVPDAVAGDARAALAALLAGGVIEARTMPVVDRYSRRSGQFEGAGGRWLQAALIEAGLALVQPLPGAEPAVLDELLRLEARAERGRRGIWRDKSRITTGSEPGDAARHLGRFVLIEGRVLQAGAQSRYFYLNFGPDWRTDTTARIDRDSLRTMQRAGFDPAALEGQRVRLRGTLFAENGPMIELWTHKGIEVLP